MPHLELTLLRSFRAELDGKPITGFESNRVRALLAYLAVLADRPHPRIALADLLWPERPDSKALADLRYALSNLREAIGDRGGPPDSEPHAAPPFLLITRDTLQFDLRSDHRLDVAAFEALTAQADVTTLKAAAALYRGDFLDGFSLDSQPFEEWVLLKREQLGRQMFRVLRALADHYEACGDYEQARQFAESQVQREPWQEEAHQQLMRVLALGGHRVAALTQYNACRRLMLGELGAAPARETDLLYEAIRDGKLVGPRLAAPLIQSPVGKHDAAGREPAGTVCVARELELRRLEVFLDQALAGTGRIAFVIGDAGSGKTVLVDEFVRRSMAAHADLLAAGGRCNAITGYGDPYLPFLDILHLLIGDLEGGTAAGMLSQEGIGRTYAALPETACALLDYGPDLIGHFTSRAALLARLEATGRGPSAHLEAQLRRRDAGPNATWVQQSELFGQFTRVLQALSRRHPLLLVLDDLQWADAGSIGLLFHLARRLGGQRILVVGVYRPGDLSASHDGARHPLQAVINELQCTYGDIHVDLDQSDGRQFVDALLDSEPSRFDVAFRETLYQYTAGQPLFTVEFLRGLQERGDVARDDRGRWTVAPTLNWATLPPRVEAVIAEHIGRLPQSWQSLLTAASVEGEVFSAEVVAQALGGPESEIRQALSGPLAREHRLVSAQGVERFGERRLSRYRFRHNLFQGYLYGRLDAVERSRLHETIGCELEATCDDESGSVAGRLAWHFESAGLLDKAVAYLRQAGERAERLSAIQEAIGHSQRGLRLLATLPESAERLEQEFLLWISLGWEFEALGGYGHPEVQRAFDRARALCLQIGTSPQMVLILFGLHCFYGMRGQYDTVRELDEEIGRIAREADDPVLMAVYERARGHIAVVTGNFAPAQGYLEQALVIRKPDHGWHFQQALEHAPVCRSFLSWTLWLYGFGDRALDQSREALAAADATAQPIVIAHALSLAAVFHWLRREVDACRSRAEADLAIATAKGFPLWEGLGHAHHGWSLAQEGRVTEGLAQCRAGAKQIFAVGALQCYPLSLTLLAETLGVAGRTAEELEVLDEAQAVERQIGSRFAAAELLRLRGELLLRDSCDEPGAEACFLQAIAMARDQQAKAWELRATVSLCRLWQRTGRREAGRDLLAGIYSKFAEGFDTPDLREAKSLLGELASPT
jgi:DNA-binding SARP family transcriptional activator/predicted ATPase